MAKGAKRILAKVLSAMLVFTLGTGMNPTNVKAEENNNLKSINETMRQQGYKINSLGEIEYNQDEIVTVIIEVEGAPAIDGKTTVQRVKSNQASIQKKAMEIAGVNKIGYSYGYLINGFTLEVRRGDIEKLRNIPGVMYVTESVTFEPIMNSAGEITGVNNVWEELGLKGEGTVVAVIDSGIDFEHKDMRLTDASKAKLDEDEIQEVIEDNLTNGEGKYYSAKVPYGYNYAEQNDNLIDSTGSDGTRMHGMHVSGIVGANGTDEEVAKGEAIKGVAPECQILAMRVFPDYSWGARTEHIIQAIEDSVALGADVINLSLGDVAAHQYSLDPQQRAVNKAVEAGVVVVAAAGNSGMSTYTKFKDVVDTGTAGSPAVAERAMSVASYENTKTVGFALDVKFGDEVEHMLYMNTVNELEGVLVGEYEVVECGLGKEEDFIGKDLNGKIALIKRGELYFNEKYLNAQNAGAIAAIVYNKDGHDEVMGMVLEDEVTIPDIFIGNRDGKRLLELIDEGCNVSFSGEEYCLDNGRSGDMSDFTSWGPSPELAFIPTITGIGGNVYSTVNTDRGMYQNMSGTSMASPFVAGSEALIIESINKNDDLTFNTPFEKAEFAKHTAIATALPQMDKQHPEVPYSPRRQGAGLVQNKEAIENKVIVLDENSSSTAALGEIGQETTFTLTFKNYSSEAATYKSTTIGGVLTEDNHTSYDMPFDVKIEGASIEFDKETVTVPANGETTVEVTIKLPKVLKIEQFIEGFIRFESKTENTPSVGIPFIGFYGNWSEPQVIDGMIWSEDSVKGMGALKNWLGWNWCTFGYEGEDEFGNEIVNPDKIALSPNNDNKFDVAGPAFVFLRRPSDIYGQIEDEKGNIVKHFGSPVGWYLDILKKYVAYEDSYDGFKPQHMANIQWDGTNDDGEIVPEGQYYYRIFAKADFKNAKEQEFAELIPIKIDLTVPTIKLLSSNKVNDKNYTLRWKAEDSYSGIAVDTFHDMWGNNTFECIEKAQVILNGEDIEFSAVSENNGIKSCNLELRDGKNEIEITAMDNAGNVITEKFTVLVGDSHLQPKNKVKIEVVQSDIEEDQANAIFKVENVSDEKQDVTLIMGVYDENNKMINYVIIKKTVNPGKTTNLYGMTKLLPEAKKVKYLVWDNMKGIIPLLDVNEISIP